MVRHQSDSNQSANVLSPARNIHWHSSYSPATRQTRPAVFRTKNDTVANSHNPVWLCSQTTHKAAMILSGCFRTFSPTSHNSCPKTWNSMGQQHDSFLLLGHRYLLFCPNMRHKILSDNVQIILTRDESQRYYIVLYCTNLVLAPAVFSTIARNLPARIFVSSSPSKFLLAPPTLPRTFLTAHSALLLKNASALRRTCPQGTLIQGRVRSRKPNLMWLSPFPRVLIALKLNTIACVNVSFCLHGSLQRLGYGVACSHRTTNLYPAWTIVSFPCNVLNIHILVLHSSLSSCTKHNLCPCNTVDIRGNDTRGTGILFYSRDDTRSLDARRSTAHLRAHTVDNGCGFHAVFPRFLTNKRRFSLFTSWMKCSFVQEL